MRGRRDSDSRSIRVNNNDHGEVKNHSRRWRFRPARHPEHCFGFGGHRVSTVSPRPRRQVTFAVLAAGVAAYTLLQSLVIPVLTGLESELHTTQSGVTWVLTANLLSASIFTPIMGRIGDVRGKKRIFMVTLAALAVGSLLAAIAPNLGVMIIARVIQGIGGGVLPLAFGIVRDEFPRERITGAVGTMAALSAAAGGLGIFLAGPIVGALGYHWLFWIPMIILVFAAEIAWIVR